MKITTAEPDGNVDAHSTRASALDTPAVSVIIPAYNAARYIGETLDSVFAQTFTDYEVIVVNDGSPDTEQLEAVLAPYADRIRYVEQENRGLSGARNTAIRHARGEFVALLDSDDKWLPEYLAVQVAAMRRDPTCDVYYPDAIIFGDSIPAGRRFTDSFPSSGEVTFERLLTQECNVMVCAIIRRETLLRVGMFDESLRSSEDFDLWLRIVKSGGRICYHEQPLAYYRRHGANLSGNVLWMRTYIFQVLDKAVNSYDLSETELAAIDRRRRLIDAEAAMYEGRHAFLGGDTRAAMNHLAQANEVYNSHRIKLAMRLLRVAPRTLLRAYRVRERYFSA